MKIYLDSGAFIDYSIGRSILASMLRKTSRRGRSPQQLLHDAQGCFAVVSAKHVGITSSLTFYEIEEAAYRERSSLPGFLPKRYAVRDARAFAADVLLVADVFTIQMVNLTPEIVRAQHATAELTERGIRAADALHIATAVLEGAELVITTDSALIRLDSRFATAAGTPLRCVDTDAALALL